MDQGLLNEDNAESREAMANAIKADTLSLVMFEIGLFGWMGFVAFVLISKLYQFLQFSGLLCR